MNFNTSPIAFFPSRNAQIWRAWFAQRKISVICGADLLPFYIIDNGNAPSSGELYDPNTDTKVADIDLSNHLLDHDIMVEGQSAHIWIYQGEMVGVFGYTNPGYFYLKIGSWYSDVFRIGSLANEYTEIGWQFFDDIITADGTPISKHIKYKQIFEVPLWHPEYNVEEEGKSNNGIFFAMQQTTKKISGFDAIVNESQLDCLNLTRMADNITIKASLNGTTKTLQTNQFEITSKWQSDDVASIECKFDLFSIVRKYQQSNEEPSPIPIPVPPTPSIYKIKGTCSLSAGAIDIYINGSLRQVFPNSGTFEYGYDSPLTGTFYFGQNPYILTLDFSESCGLKQITSFGNIGFSYLQNLESINFSGCTFAALINAQSAFEGLSKMKQISLPNATFANVTNASRMFANGRTTKSGETYAQVINAPNATFASVTNAKEMFYKQSNLQEDIKINMPNATFASVTNVQDMFYNVTMASADVILTSATFATLTDATKMFRHCKSRSDNSATKDFVFSNVFPAFAAQITNATSMFDNANKYIDVSGLDCSHVTTADRMFASVSGNTSAVIWKLTLPNTLTAVTSAKNMFNAAYYDVIQTAINNAGLTFATVTDAEGMFADTRRFENANTTFSMPNVTFANLANAKDMFSGNSAVTITMMAATFASVTTFSKMFYNCESLVTLTMPNCSFAAITVSDFEPISICNKLENITLGENATCGPWRFLLKLTKVKAASVVSVLNTCRANSQYLYQNLVVIQDTYDGYSAAEKSAIQAALPSGWSISWG